MWHKVEIFFYVEMDRGWMYSLASTDMRYLMGIITFITASIADAVGMDNLYSANAEIAIIS